MAQPQTTQRQDHVERARQIADALDSQNMEQTLHEQFYAEWKAWEAEDPTRTMAAFDRAIGRSGKYTSRIVQFVTGGSSTPWGNKPQSGRDEVATRRTLRDRPQEVAPEIAKAMENPDVREAVARHMTTQTANDISDAVRGLPHEPVERERRRKEAETFARGITEPIVDAFSRSNVILHLEQALEDLRELGSIDGTTHDRGLMLLDELRTEFEVKRAMEGVR